MLVGKRYNTNTVQIILLRRKVNEMSENKSLSTQEVADILHVSKSMIYELIRREEIVSYKIGRKVRFTQDDVDAYIARSRHEQSTQPIKRVEVTSELLSPEDDNSGLIISGQDVILDILSSQLRQKGIKSSRCYLSGFEGLLSLYQEKVNIVACHLYDTVENEYNIPYVRMLMPGTAATVINLSYRMQGLYVKQGNPKKIRTWKDLARDDVTIINRRPASASRILLDEKLHSMGIAPERVRGYDNIMVSHLTLATAISEGQADVGIGTQRISKKLEGLEFIPLMRERYDMVVRKELMETAEMKKLLEILRSDMFRKEISGISGNDYQDMGKIIAEV
jgi:DNA binding domain, excisionase family